MMIHDPPRRGSKLDPAQQREKATSIAIGALSFVAAKPEELGRFLSLTGINPESIRAAAREPGFLVGVLDHLANDERLLLAFANQSGLSPEDVGQARAILANEASCQ